MTTKREACVAALYKRNNYSFKKKEKNNFRPFVFTKVTYHTFFTLNVYTL